MMRVDLDVSVGFDDKTHARVRSQRLQHVRKERQVGDNFRLAALIEAHLN